MKRQVKAKVGKIFSLSYSLIIAAIIVITNSTTTLAVNSSNIRSNKENTRWLAGFKSSQMTNSPQSTGNNLSPEKLSSEETKMILLINQERMEAGLSELQVDSGLVELARVKSLDMVRFNYFGHTSKNIGTMYDQLEKAKIVYETAAENLIAAPNYRKAHQKILLSPFHRSNILNPKFTKIGIGIIKGGPYGEMITQIFIN